MGQNSSKTTKQKITYNSNIDINLKHFEELTIMSQYTNRNLNIKKEIVNIVDRLLEEIWIFLTMMNVLSLYNLNELFTHKKNFNTF